MIGVRSAHGNKAPITTAELSVIGMQAAQQGKTPRPGIYGIELPIGKYQVLVRAVGYKDKTVLLDVGLQGATGVAELTSAID